MVTPKMVPRSSHTYGGGLRLDLQTLLSLVFKCTQSNFSSGEVKTWAREGRSGIGDWRGFNFVSHWLNGPQCIEACAS